MKKNIKKFNGTDVVILLALIAVASAIIFRNSAEKMIEDLFYKTQITYFVLADKEGTENLKEGMILFDNEKNMLGTVENIKDDTDTSEEYPDRYEIEISTQGMRDSIGTYIGDGMFIAPGKNLQLYTDENNSFICIVRKVEIEE